MSELPPDGTYALVRVAAIGEGLAEALPSILVLAKVVNRDHRSGAVKLALLSAEEHVKVWATPSDLEMIGAPLPDLLAALGEGEPAIEARLAEREVWR